MCDGKGLRFRSEVEGQVAIAHEVGEKQGDMRGEWRLRGLSGRSRRV